MTADSRLNEYSTTEHALKYLARADKIPHRTAGEAALLEFLPAQPRWILDLGTGDGRLLALARIGRPGVRAVALDFSPTMLDAVRERFRGDDTVGVIDHDLEAPLPALGRFEAVISSFAIHHVPDERKRALYAEIHGLLLPGGVFCNLEHVASPTPALHAAFLGALGITEADEDPSNRLAPLELQLQWLREIGFVDVDCHWKWRELALLGGRRRPASFDPSCL